MRKRSHKIHFYHLALIIISIFYDTHEGLEKYMNVEIIYEILFSSFFAPFSSANFSSFPHKIDHLKLYYILECGFNASICPCGKITNYKEFFLNLYFRFYIF